MLDTVNVKADILAEAEKYNGTVVWWRIALDNYSPVRGWASGYAVRYTHPTSGVCLKFWPDNLREAITAVYIVDDGKTAAPYYVAGWTATDPKRDDVSPAPGSFVLLHSFPVNAHDATRPDNGRAIDYDAWELGPRRAYHMKVKAD